MMLFAFTAIVLVSLTNGCKKSVPAEEKIPAETIATNQWIYETLNLYYYWNNFLPTNIDNTKEKDPEAYFYKLLYVPTDKWSFITSDYPSLEAELSGVPTTMGYHPAFYLTGSNKVIIAVSYVYPGSPADAAGLKRGDIILSIDNTQLDTTNYYDKYSGTSYSVQLGKLEGNTLTPTGVSLNMTASVTQTDPAIYHTVLDTGGKKVGYLVYVEFITGNNNAYLTDLENIFNEFKTAGVSDIIVDLRYNPGGQVDAAIRLASLIAPATATTTNKIMINLNYNSGLQNYLLTNNMGEYLNYKFENDPANLNMSNVYFLTTSRSASASELVIVGLEPYMNVIKIGESTYGKYVGSWVLPDTANKWAMMPIVTKFSNVDGYTDFVNGLAPDYSIQDDPITAVPFGDVTDPMVAKALTLITGKSGVAKSLKTYDYSLFRQIVPKEMNPGNLIINGIIPFRKK